MTQVQLLPLGNLSTELLDAIGPPLESVFHVPIETRRYALALDEFFDPQRGQFNSTSILLHLRSSYPHFHPGVRTKLLAVMPDDLFIPILTYVFGEAEVGGSVAVVSTFRLLPERYGLGQDKPLFERRVLTEAVHEIGHAFGLIHCSEQDCAMHSSSSVEEIDLKGWRLCDVCAEELKKKRDRRKV
jgi:archaemetzincin